MRRVADLPDPIMMTEGRNPLDHHRGMSCTLVPSHGTGEIRVRAVHDPL
ncbi:MULTISPECIES: hypothetical protein [Micromonospora]|nr:hypothetical protein [Micromonospora sp. NRRL B-16802]